MLILMSPTDTPENIASATIDCEPKAERALPEAAIRALAEAEARRAAKAAEDAAAPKEIGGTSGPDPARYGDWEKAGIASDF